MAADLPHLSQDSGGDALYSGMVVQRVGIVALLLFFVAAPATAKKATSWGFQNLSPDTYLPGAHVAFTVADPPASQVLIYALPLERVLAERDNVAWNPNVLHGLAQVAAGTLATSADGRLETADVGTLPLGYYAAAIGSGEAQRRWIFSISSFGLVRASTGYCDVVWAVDLRTFDRATQPISMWQYSNSGRQPLKVDADSLAVDRSIHERNAAVLATAKDGSYQVAGLSPNAPQAPRTSLVTDRPIYRPGQTVAIRAIVRDGSIGAYRIPQGTVRLTVFAPYEKRAIAQRTLHISSYGTVATSIRLPQTAVPGPYGISLDDERAGGYFQVADYKKPEFMLHVKTDHSWIVAGDLTTVDVGAKYFFGRSAAGLRLQYASYLSGQSFYPLGEVPFFAMMTDLNSWLSTPTEGETTTDASGNARFALTAPPTDRTRLLVMTVRGTDASGRTVSARMSLADHPADVDVHVSPSRYFAATGQSDRISVHTRNLDGSVRPNQLVALAISQIRWNRRSQRYDRSDTVEHSVVSDARGEAVFDWAPSVAGSYEFVARSADERGRVAAASAFAAAQGEGLLPGDGRLSVVPEKTTLAPGEHARVLVLAPEANRDVLVAVCADRLVRTQVVHIAGNSTVLDEAPPSGAARFSVSVLQPGESGGSTEVAWLRIDPPPHRLSVQIVPSKRRYVPGEIAHVRVEVHDEGGRPVHSEVALGVVDEAIYALREDRRESPFDSFYGDAEEMFGSGNWDMTAKRYNEGLRSIGNVSARAAVPPPSISASSDSSEVREHFADTAFWSPSVITDARGRATVAFRWPDDLTTWRATGTAVTRSTSMGAGTANALVTKDFLVRLETPRFLRVGDRSTLTGIAHGAAVNTAASLHLDAGAFGAQPQAQRASFDRNAVASASWAVSATQIGAFPVTLYGSDGMRNDAMRTMLAVEGATPEEHLVSGGAGSGTAEMSVPPGYHAGSVTVTLLPSPIAQLVQSVRLLEIYPYDCTEQTLSAALPALFVERALKQRHAETFANVHTADVIARAQTRLWELRHRDGSYGWWERDAANPFMTAYALYGMAEMKKDGYAASIDPVVDSVIAQLSMASDDTQRFSGSRQRGSRWDTRAFMLFALADAAPNRVDAAMLADARAHASAMNPYALAVLGLAEHYVGDDASARDLLRQLDSRVIDDGSLAYWSGKTWDYGWEDDPIETTAYALRLQIALDPASALIPRVISFLRGQLHGGWAYTTKDTAATIYALSEALPGQPAEMHPNETVRVTVDGRTIKRVRITRPVLDEADAEVVIPAGDVRDGSEVGIAASGIGTLYWSTDFTRYVSPQSNAVVDKETPLLQRLFPPRPDVTIRRAYVAERPGPWHAGERIDVEIRVTSRRDLQYVAIEDPFPAGAEHSVAQGSAGEQSWSGLAFLDDRVSFFTDRLAANKPMVLRYALDLTTPGTYTAPPTTVSSMYGPPARALGNSNTITIGGAPP